MCHFYPYLIIMNDIETPLLGIDNNNEILKRDKECIKYSMKICFYILLFLVFLLFVMILLETICGNNKFIDLMSEISIGASIVVSFILIIAFYIVFLHLKYKIEF